MRVAFIIDKSNYYRSFSSLIAEGLKRGADIECWHRCDPALKAAGKGYLYADPAKAPFDPADHPTLSIIAFESNAALQTAIAVRQDITHIVSLLPPEFLAGEEILNRFNGIWCQIMHGPDSFKDTQKFRKMAMNRHIRQIFAPNTQHFFDWGMEFSDQFMPEARRYFIRPNVQIHPIGFPMVDDSILQLPQERIRQKYGIPPGKKLLIYLPYAFLPSKESDSCRAWQSVFSTMHIRRKASCNFDDDSYRMKTPLEIGRGTLSHLKRIMRDRTARQWLFNGWHEPAVLKALRTFCDHNDLLLVIKPRRKFDFSEAGYRLADIVIDDDESQQYPSKLQELLSITALGVGYFTTAVIEAAAQGVPFINIESPDDRFTDPERRPWHPNHPDSLYNFRGVVANLTVPDFIASIPAASLASLALQRERQEEYLRYFVSPGKSPGENFFDALQ